MAGFVAMLDLIAGCVEVAIVIGELLFASRPGMDAAMAAIETDAAFEALVDAAVVNVVDDV